MQYLSVESADNQLTLNGSTIYGNFLADIYRVELFVSKKTRQAEEIISSSAPKLIKLTFLLDIGQDRLKQSWLKTLEMALGNEFNNYSSSIEKFISQISDIREKDTMELYFEGSILKIFLNNSLMAEIQNKIFTHAVFAIWLGNHPIAKKTKEGLLGLL